MTMRLTREAYQKLVTEDLAWLLQQPRSLERDHIFQILVLAVDYEYGPARGAAGETGRTP